MASISPDQLEQSIGQILQTFNHSVETSVDYACKECGKVGASLMTKSSPRRSGAYAKSWTSTPTKRGTVYIHNKKHYRLTHLLEKGHKTNFKTGKYGKTRMTSAVPHISKVEDYLQEQFPAMIKKRIETQK